MIDWQVILSIIAINVVYVAVFTLRLILLIKGRRPVASLLAMIEVFIYLLGLNLVLQNVNDPFNMAAYCLGFGFGVYVGSRIEEMLALGYLVIQVIVETLDTTIPGKLRGLGYGVTAWPAEGRDGPRLVMQVLVKRTNERRFMDSLLGMAPNAFVLSHEPKSFRGGFWVRITQK